MLEDSGKETHHLQQLLTENNKSMISFYQYEAVKLELEATQSHLGALKTHLALTVADKDALFSNLADVKNSLVFVMAHIDKLYEKTNTAVTVRMSVLEDKVIRVQDVIKETVQFSDRTYFMEESRKLRAEKLRVEKERGMYKDKLRIAQKRVRDLEGGANILAGTLEEMHHEMVMESTAEIYRRVTPGDKKPTPQAYDK